MRWDNPRSNAAGVTRLRGSTGDSFHPFLFHLLSIALLLASCADPQVEDPPTLYPPLPCRYQTIRHLEADYDVVYVDLRAAEIQLFWKGSGNGERFGRFSRVREWLASQGRTMLMATNAGIFLPGYIPEGLYVERGRRLVDINLNRGFGNFYLQPNGIFSIGSNGAHVMATRLFHSLGERDTIYEATQSGPMLVTHGMIHPVFEAESMHLNIRSGVAAISPDEVAIVISRQKVNLYAFATFFRDSLRCSDALYLDGSISKLYAPSLGRHEDGEFAAILAVVPKEEQKHIIPAR